MRIKSTSSEETERLGKVIGSNLRGGEIFVLQSDLGGGKTTFTRGIVEGTGSNDVVASPTFTISRVYESPLGQLHHFDFYRLQEPGIIAHELEEVLEDTQSIIIIEWSAIIADMLPANRTISVSIAYNNENGREIHVQAPRQLSYILKGVQ